MAGRMVRKQVYIEPHQEAMLKRLAREAGVAEAEVIRKAIDQQAGSLLTRRRELAAWQQERDLIRQLIERGPVPGKRRWRREELHER